MPKESEPFERASATSPAELFFGGIADLADPAGAAVEGGGLVNLRNERELQEFIADVWGVHVPGKRVCKHHRAPLEALAAGYFAEHPRIVWKASRGFGGKSVLMAAMSLTEARCLGAGVSVLGGSLEQSKNVHDYMQGLGNMAGRFWASPAAPRSLLRSDPTQRLTYLANGGWIKALPASLYAVRGPHPQRLRGDELDDMDEKIWDAAQGQAQEDQARGIVDQVVGSSTHHNPNGTMTRELKMAAAQGWPVFEWCYRETMAEGGFISQRMVERKRKSVTARDWNTEWELQEPNPEGLAIDVDAVDRAFLVELGEHPGEMGTRIMFEQPVKGATYATGVDWGKEEHHTVIWTNRTDVKPMRLVAFASMGRLPYPVMEDAFERRLKRFPGPACYDHTGVGVGIGDHLEAREDTIPVDMVGRDRTKLFQDWIAGLEHGEFEGPRIEAAYKAHRSLRTGDLYGSGHPPDEFVAAALAYRASNTPPFHSR